MNAIDVRLESFLHSTRTEENELTDVNKNAASIHCAQNIRSRDENSRCSKFKNKRERRQGVFFRRSISGTRSLPIIAVLWLTVRAREPGNAETLSEVWEPTLEAGQLKDLPAVLTLSMTNTSYT